MKRLILITILFYNVSCDYIAQNIVTTKSALECDQAYRKLPVFYFDNGQDTKTITDTFWIRNTFQNDIPIFLNPYYHEDWNMPSVIKANSQEPLVYHKVFENFEGYYCPINQGALIQYGNSKLSVALYTQLVNKNATMQKMPDGSFQFLIPLDSLKHNYLYTFPNGIMKEAGCKLNADSSKIGGITFKSKNSDGYDVKYHGKTFSFELMNADIKDCKVYYSNKLTKKDYQIYVTTNKFNYTFPENAHEIKITKGSSSISYPLVEGENNRTYPLYLLEPTEPYIMIDHIKRPVNYNHHQYAVFYNAMSNQADNQIFINYYLKSYPDLTIFNIQQKNVFDLEKLSETKRASLLHDLEKDSLVISITKLLNKSDGKTNFQIFNNKIHSVFPISVKEDNLIEKVNQFDFEYISTEVLTSFTHFFKYKNKLWDERAMQQFNKLYQSYPYYDFKIEKYF